MHITRSGLLALAMAVVGCRAEGVNIEIEIADTGATKVRLYVAEEPCKVGGAECPGMLTPKDFAQPLTEVEMYTRSLQTVVETEVDDGLAVFRLQAPDEGTQLVPVLIAVGLNDNNIPVAVAVHDKGLSVGGPERRFLTLEPLRSRDPDNDAAPLATVWPPLANETCVAVDIERGDGERARLAITPFDDHDCDAVMTDECDDQWYMKPADANVDGPPCVTNAIDPQLCLLGERQGCADGRPPGLCQAPADPAPRQCVPAATCDAIAECAPTDFPCLISRFKEGSVTCQVGVINSALCVGATQVPLGPLFESDAVCASMSFSYIRPAGFDMPQSELVLAPGLTLKGTLEPGACVATLTLESPGGGPIAVASLPTIAVRIRLSNGEEAILPFSFTTNVLVPECGGSFSCELPDTPDPSLARCAGP